MLRLPTADGHPANRKAERTRLSQTHTQPNQGRAEGCRPQKVL